MRVTRYRSGPGLGAMDDGLKSETIYYYSLFRSGDAKPLAQVAAMATGPYNMAEQIYNLLPAIYRRYDAAADRPDGPLRRFLDLPGGQFDQLYSFTRALLDLHDLDRVDGRLLPLLADWIGWRTDFHGDLQAQRNELRHAPAIQETVATIPTIEATVKRLIGWECRAKEFANNVFRSNQPERLNLWATQRINGAWTSPTLPLSLDFAYEGRPAAVIHTEADGTTRRWLFYHTPCSSGVRSSAVGSVPPLGSWTVCYKTALSFRLDRTAFIRHFEQANSGQASLSTALLDQFAQRGLPLSLDLTIDEQIPAGGPKPGTPRVWLITDRRNYTRYTVREADADHLVVSSEWSPSQPAPDQDEGAMNRHPTAVWLDDTLWVFWDAYDENTRGWRIECRTYRSGQWQSCSDGQPAPWAGQGRRSPCAVVHANALWLFWMERTEDGWRLRFSRRGDGQVWSDAVNFPLIPAEVNQPAVDPRVESDLFALAPPNQPLMLFWARREPVQDQPGQTRWRIVYRLKQGDDPAVNDWSPIHPLPEPPPDADEREPAAMIEDGKIELFWSSTRDGSGSLWRAGLDVGSAEPVSTAEQLTFGPYNERTPLPLANGTDTLLVYRSSASVPYTSPTYSATRTLDPRYAGCTSVDTRNAARKGLRTLFDDFETYTYDTGPQGTPNNETWYARDVVGIYLRAEVNDNAQIETNRQLIDQFLPEFLPIQVRLVYIIETPVKSDVVYSGDQPVEETWWSLASVTGEQHGVIDEHHTPDTIVGWTWLRAWIAREPPAPLKVTNNLSYRTRHIDVAVEE